MIGEPIGHSHEGAGAGWGMEPGGPARILDGAALVRAVLSQGRMAPGFSAPTEAADDDCKLPTLRHRLTATRDTPDCARTDPAPLGPKLTKVDFAMSKESLLPADELIDPSLDLEPVPGLAGIVTGWRDRNTALVFEWEASRVHVLDPSNMTFRLKSADLPGTALVVAHLQRIGKVLEPQRIVKYRVSAADLFAILDEMRGDTLDAANHIVDRLGGRQVFLEYCLKAIRACHLKYLKSDTGDDGKPRLAIRKTADKVEFEIVN